MYHTTTNSQNLIRITGCYQPISSSAQQVAHMKAQDKKKKKGVCLWKHLARPKQNKTEQNKISNNDKLENLLKAKTKD